MGTSGRRHLLRVEPLTRDAFASFGQVIDTDGADSFSINEGTTVRFDDLARVELCGAAPSISIFRAQPLPLPVQIRLLERHPLGTQAFMPLQSRDWLIVVSSGAAAPEVENLRAFLAGGRQGVNYGRNVWHHPLLVIEPDSDFLVVDRGSSPENLEEHRFPQELVIELAVDLA